MFGKKRGDHPHAIDISKIDLSRSKEFLRAWSSDGPTTYLIEPANLNPDPLAMGLAITDIVRHAAKAWSQYVVISEAEAEARIWEGIDAERQSPTSPATQINEKAD